MPYDLAGNWQDAQPSSAVMSLNDVLKLAERNRQGQSPQEPAPAEGWGQGGGSFVDPQSAQLQAVRDYMKNYSPPAAVASAPTGGWQAVPASPAAPAGVTPMTITNGAQTSTVYYGQNAQGGTQAVAMHDPATGTLLTRAPTGEWYTQGAFDQGLPGTGFDAAQDYIQGRTRTQIQMQFNELLKVMPPQVQNDPNVRANILSQVMARQGTVGSQMLGQAALQNAATEREKIELGFGKDAKRDEYEIAWMKANPGATGAQKNIAMAEYDARRQAVGGVGGPGTPAATAQGQGLPPPPLGAVVTPAVPGVPAAAGAGGFGPPQLPGATPAPGQGVAPGAGTQAGGAAGGPQPTSGAAPPTVPGLLPGGRIPGGGRVGLLYSPPNELPSQRDTRLMGLLGPEVYQQLSNAAANPNSGLAPLMAEVFRHDVANRGYAQLTLPTILAEINRTQPGALWGFMNPGAFQMAAEGGLGGGFAGNFSDVANAREAVRQYQGYGRPAAILMRGLSNLVGGHEYDVNRSTIVPGSMLDPNRNVFLEQLKQAAAQDYPQMLRDNQLQMLRQKMGR
jgi:hypothetical protein